MSASDYSEDTLIEQPAIALFGTLGYETINAFHEKFGDHGTLGRLNKSEVVLRARLRAALIRLNPAASPDAMDAAVDELARDRSAMNPVTANRDVYLLLKEGLTLVRDADGGESTIETVRFIDWDRPEANDFLLVSQFWVTGEIYTRRADLVAFVNGVPLVLFELKAVHARLEAAFDDNLRDYKTTIPQLFWFNALVVLSTGVESRIGTMSAAWEHFSEWKKINDEGERGVVSLETVIRGVCAPDWLLDLIENFTLYTDGSGKLAKLVAKNHQFLGVNNAVARLSELATRPEEGGRLGVFWHTQGSGKSYSMVFFTQKVLRKQPGNWTFVIVTDRQELDDQIYRTFAESGAVTETDVHARDGLHLKQLLQENHRTVFSLIQKFHTPPGVPYDVLSERSDIIVITDEAHRSQYNTLAMNMRRALPNARFMAFTGTPLIVGEEKTRELFGDYVSIYNFRDSIEDGATVPLYYENRVPEVQLTNVNLNDDLRAVIEAAELSDEAEHRLEREFAREYHLITRDERLETIAADIVRHYLGRFAADGAATGKAMVVSIDKPTTVRMYDKVAAHWRAKTAEFERALAAANEPAERVRLAQTVAFMRATDMAVVVSQSQNEEAEFNAKGLTILPHRKRMVSEDLDDKFKDPADPFRIVFVTAMWLTGFDVPSLATVYLDKPMHGHTLMQTIARANRVFGGKTNGLIVDYAGIFRNLEQALAIYGAGAGGSTTPGDLPVKSKDELIQKLRDELANAEAFCLECGVQLDPIVTATGFIKAHLLDGAVDALIATDDLKKRFIAHANSVALLFRAILPDATAQEFAPRQALLGAIAKRIRSLSPQVDLDGVMREIDVLLDHSIAAEGYLIQETLESNLIDLSQIDFDALRLAFEKGLKHIETERLRGAIERKLQRLVELNHTRLDYVQKFQELIDAYNSGAKNVQLFLDELVIFARALNEEEERAVSEGLSEEELAVFDLLTKPGPALTPAEQDQVKKIARDLLANLKHGKLVLDWRKKQQAKAQVQVTIKRALNRKLPSPYSSAEKDLKTESLYQHVYDAYSGQGASRFGVEPTSWQPQYG